MLSIFLNSVLPVFAAVIVGYAFGHAKLFSSTEAHAINKTAFYFFVPALLFRLVAQVSFDDFDVFYVLGYMGAEVAIYALTLWLCYSIFQRRLAESLLLSMTAAFCNHTFFILPIAEMLYGPDAVLPVVSVISIDLLVFFGGTVLALEFVAKKREGSALRNLSVTLCTNPNIMALLAGVVVSVSGISIDNGVGFYLSFVGAAAAPASLFALGVSLSLQPAKLAERLVLLITGLKLLLFPAIAWLLFVPVFTLSEFWVGPGILVAAGPSGVLASVLSSQYGVQGKMVSQVILVTTFFSVLTVTTAAMLTA